MRTDWIWGVNGHNRMYASYPERNLEQQISLAAGLGVGIYRFNFNPDTAEDFAYLDRVIALCKEKNLSLMLVMDGLSDPAETLSVRYANVAKRYDGVIPYIQIFNEVDVYCMVGAPVPGNGFFPIHFNAERLAEMLPKFKAAIAAVRQHSVHMKTVINISYQHTYLFDYLAENGVKWDITGLDWYKNMYWKSKYETGYDNILPRLCDRYPQDILICETNIWPDKQRLAGTYFRDKTYLPTVMKHVYETYPRVKGMIFYELLDEPQFQSEERPYDGESHFGLVTNDGNGNPGEPKPIYYAIQKLITDGGYFS